MRRMSGAPGGVAKRRAVRWAAGPARRPRASRADPGYPPEGWVQSAPPQAARAGVPSRLAPERQPRGRRPHDVAPMITHVRSPEIRESRNLSRLFFASGSAFQKEKRRWASACGAAAWRLVRDATGGPRGLRAHPGGIGPLPAPAGGAERPDRPPGSSDCRFRSAG